MASIGNFGTYLYKSYDATGANREDLLNWIANIDPYDTPLLVTLPKVKANSTWHQWLTDTLSAVATRGQIVEGADWASQSLTAPSRVQNVCEIFGKDIAVTETQRAENPAGFADAYAYQLEKATKETMRNIESALMNAGTSATGPSSTGRVMKSLDNFITTNKYVSTNYSTAAGGTATAGIFSANNVNAMLQTIWAAGGKTDLLVMNGSYKRQFSALTSSNTRNILAEQKKIVVGIDVYDSDFGLIPIQLNRWSPQSTNPGTSTATAGVGASSTDISGRIWFLQRSMCRVAWLREMHHRLIGTKGDSTAGLVRAECTLEVGNQAACGVFTGVNNRATSIGDS